MYKQIEDQQAWYISRVKSQLLLYEKKGDEYKELTYTSIIKRIKQSGKRYLDMVVYLGRAKKHRVRLIANLLDGESVAKRAKRKKHRKQGTLNKKDKQYCQLNLFVTNISFEKASADDIYNVI